MSSAANVAFLLALFGTEDFLNQTMKLSGTLFAGAQESGLDQVAVVLEFDVHVISP